MTQVISKISRLNAGQIAVCFLIGLIAASFYFVTSMYSLVDKSRSERETLLLLTNSFVQAFSENRGADSDIVPATHRRIALDYFNAKKQEIGGHIRMTMPGLPGFEINTQTQDADLAKYIKSFQENDSREVRKELLIKGGRIIDKTLLPSVASSQSCVDCHNKISDKREWKLGEVMGAFVVITDLTSDTTALIANAGYVFLFVFVTSLLVSIREQRRMQNTVNRLKGEIYKLTSIDALTKLPNRSRFEYFTNKLIDEKTQFALFMIDLDKFKPVNDQYGHQAGDALLVYIANRLNEIFDGTNSVICRFGGDEFIIAMQYANGQNELEQFGRLIQSAICIPFDYNDVTLMPACSVGASLHMAQSGKTKTLEELIDEADKALYKAKNSGRGVVKVYSQHSDEQDKTAVS